MYGKLIHLFSVAAVLAVVLASSATAADPNLVGWWQFEEASGTLYDQSDYHNNGTAYDGVLYQQTGFAGYALGFDGINDRVVVGTTARPTDTFSFGAWLRTSATHQIDGESTSGVGGVAGQRYAFDPQHGGDANGGAGLSVGTNGILVYEHGSNYMPATAVYSADIGTDWNHIMVVYDNKRPTIYLNGQAVRTGLVSPRATVLAPIQFGGMAYGYFEGLMDEVRIYNRALSAAEVRVLAARPKAYGPDPSDGAQGIISPLLTWKAGTSAAFHDVYLGTNPTPGAAEYKGRQPLAWNMWFEAAEWIPGATYYWRIDEIEADSTTVHMGDVWSFTAAPYTAFNPSPSDGAENVWLDGVELSWTQGKDASSHDVYFGSDETAVTDGTGGTFKGNQTDLFYNTGPMEVETTYYWRIDEHEGTNVHTGDVWEFTTTKRGPGGAVYRYYSGFGGVLISDLTGNPAFPDNPTGTQLVDDFEGPVNWADNYGVQMYGWLYPPGTGSYTFWLATDDAGELWLSTDDDPANRVLIASVEGWVPSRDWDGTGGGVPGTNQMSSPVALEAGKRYYIEGLMKEAGGGDNISAAWQGPGIPTRELITGEYVAPTPHPPVRASTPNPTDGAVNVVDTPTLEWVAGAFATQHDVYFGTDVAAVAAADTTTAGIYRTRQATTSYAPGTLEWGKTYYWKINELNLPDIWEGDVWSFTVAEFIGIDDFEDYNDYCGRIFYTYVDGWGHNGDAACGVPPSGGNGTGSTVGYLSEPYAEQTITHDGSFQSMPMEYLNDGSTGKALYSETERTFDAAQDWTRKGVKALSLWFRGLPGSVGSFNYDAGTGIYTMTADGQDIWNTQQPPGSGNWVEHDEFHYAYKQLSSNGSIQAQVLSVANTNTWAKAGVMIRETLDVNSIHAMMVVTPGQGVSFQRRPTVGGASEHTTLAGFQAPRWVRLTRSANDFTAEHSADGSTWETVGTQNIPMAANVYIGLALTSHNTNPTVACTGTFSDVTTSGTVTGQWQSQDIGITSNDAEQLYVALEDSTGTVQDVPHPDPNAVQLNTWQEWNIDLADFAPVDLTKVKKMYIGVGDRDAPESGGGGMLYIDDIRLYRPRCIPSLTKPAADFDNSCVVDYPDVEILADNWLRIVWDTTGGHDGSGSLAFGPPGDYVAIQDLHYQGNDYAAVSVCAWIRTDSDATQYVASFDRNEYWRLEINGSGAGPGQVGWDVMTNTGQVDYGSDTRVDDGQWHHVVGVFDNGTLVIYIDGSAEPSATGGPTFGRGNTRFGFLGANSEATVFDGARGGGNPVQQLSDLRIYDYALSAADITGLAQGTADPPTGPILWYKLDETSGNIAADSSGNGYDGHLVFSWFDMNLHDDTTINFKDYAILADTWLDEALWP